MQLPELRIKVERKDGDGQVYQVKSSNDAATFFRTIFNADTMLWTEESAMICLNRANEVIGYFKVSSGGTASTIMDAKVIFTQALQSGAHSIILAHNHPSGNRTPSDNDIKLTKQLVKGAELLDMRVLDHIILTETSHMSMADENYI
jgi:DNA repair protein RadC